MYREDICVGLIRNNLTPVNYSNLFLDPQIYTPD